MNDHEYERIRKQFDLEAAEAAQRRLEEQAREFKRKAIEAAEQHKRKVAGERTNKVYFGDVGEPKGYNTVQRGPIMPALEPFGELDELFDITERDSPMRKSMKAVTSPQRYYTTQTSGTTVEANVAPDGTMRWRNSWGTDWNMAPPEIRIAYNPENDQMKTLLKHPEQPLEAVKLGTFPEDSEVIIPELKEGFKLVVVGEGMSDDSALSDAFDQVSVKGVKLPPKAHTLKLDDTEVLDDKTVRRVALFVG